MLVLTRMTDQIVTLTLPDGQTIDVMVVGISGDKVRLGFTAPKEISVHRKEVHDRICRENR